MFFVMIAKNSCELVARRTSKLLILFFGALKLLNSWYLAFSNILPQALFSGLIQWALHPYCSIPDKNTR